MRHCITLSGLAALGLILTASAATAQEIEPGVQTSSAAVPVKPAPQPSKPSDATAPAQSAAKAKSASTPATKPATTPAGNNRSDRIDLGTTQISGNRELPKVMYVVPWRRADPGDFAGRPPNSLLDEALTPVDRDVFRRQNSYYGAVRAQTQPEKSPADAVGGTATPKDEK
jgi:hypothetical protein